MTEQLLPWLNGQIDLRVAYSYTRTQVIARLPDIVNRPGPYGISPQYEADLTSIYNSITQLLWVSRDYESQRVWRLLSFISHPNGPDYLNPPPPQSIARAVNDDQRCTIASLRVLKYEYGGIKYWALPDLLGLFMSSLGHAPTGATRRNFYLPLTAVFGQWCSKLIRQERSSRPVVFQCTWNEGEGGVFPWRLERRFCYRRGSRALAGRSGPRSIWDY